MKIELIIYLLGVLTGCSFGIAISMLVDYFTNGIEEKKTLGKDELYNGQIEELVEILKGEDDIND